MMQYVSFVWNERDPSAESDVSHWLRALQEDPRRGWVVVHKDGGLLIVACGLMANIDGSYPLEPAQGVILGKLFERDNSHESGRRLEAITPQTVRKIVQSEGRHLIEAYWGRWVGFFKKPRTGAVLVVRDPAGGLPCYSMCCGRVRLFFSSIDPILEVTGAEWRVNWDFVAARLALFAVDCHHTGLEDVTQVLSGEQVECDRDLVLHRQMLWRPEVLATEEVVEDRNIAERLLRQAILSSVRSWASAHERVLVRLSGGVDSSIVTGCLAQCATTADVVCLNYFWPGAECDEREYARASARHANRSLIERERSVEWPLEKIFSLVGSPMPGDYMGYLEYGPTETALCKEIGATCRLTGEGGDQVLYEVEEVLPGVDAAWMLGICSETFRAILEASYLGRRSFAHTLKQAFLYGVLRKEMSARIDLSHMSTLLDPSVAHGAISDSRFVHPTLRRVANVAPGKRRQLLGLLSPMDYMDPYEFGGETEYVHALLSQPVVEACLRIPLHILAHGGRGRALARKAMSQYLAARVARRRSKGSVDEPRMAMLLRNMPFIREVLMEGLLVKQGYLKRNAVESALSMRPGTMETAPAEIFGCLSVEAWLQSWDARTRRYRPKAA